MLGFGLVLSGIGLLLVVIGTRLRHTVGGSVLLILGSAVLAVGLLFLGMERLTRGA